ncbi:MAG: site-specific integrase [Burkholderiales bacterium]|nr:site-specific integrase [Burkholderiales bacterium]
MPIQKIARDGATTYKVQIRRRGFPSVFKTFDRYSEAKAFEERTLREQATRAAHGVNVNLTLAEVIDTYVASDEYAALRSDRSAYHTHWRNRLGGYKLVSLNRSVYQHEADLLAKGGRDGKRSRQTVAVYTAALGTALKFAVQRLTADSRALAELRCCSFTAASNVRGRALEPAEVRNLLAAADAAPWKHWPLVVRLLLVTAGRKSDILQRRRRDVDLDAGTVLVPVQKNGDPKLMIVPPGEVLDMLAARCEGLQPDELLFPGRLKTTALDPKKSWPKLVTAAGLPDDCTMHWLRKTTATTLLRAGVDIASVQKITGHKTAAVLLKHYASAGEARQREVACLHAPALLGVVAA